MCEHFLSNSFAIQSGNTHSEGGLINDVGFFHIGKENGIFYISHYHYNGGNKETSLDQLVDLASKYKIAPKDFISGFAFKVSEHLLKESRLEVKNKLEDKLLKEANL